MLNPPARHGFVQDTTSRAAPDFPTPHVDPDLHRSSLWARTRHWPLAQRQLWPLIWPWQVTLQRSWERWWKIGHKRLAVSNLSASCSSLTTSWTHQRAKSLGRKRKARSHALNKLNSVEKLLRRRRCRRPGPYLQKVLYDLHVSMDPIQAKTWHHSSFRCKHL